MLRISTDKGNGKINKEKSLFEIIVLAEIIQTIKYGKLFLLQTVSYYYKHKDIAFEELINLKNEIVKLGGSKNTITTINKDVFLKNIDLIKKHANLKTDFFYVLSGNISCGKTTPFGQLICLDKI